MQTELTGTIGATSTIPNSRLQAVIGRGLSGFAAVFLFVDGAAKLFPIPAIVEGAQQLGYRPDTMPAVGLTLLACVALYLIPRTSALGALLLTGYLGGAVATHVRVGSPLFSHILFPTYVATFLWGGLLLRNASLRVILPLRKRA